VTTPSIVLRGKGDMNFDRLKGMVDNPPTPWIAMSGMYYETLEIRHVKIVVPVKGRHLNHVGTVYGGTMFMILEVSGALLFFSAYGMDRFVPVLKKCEIEYLKPTSKDLVADLRMSEEEARDHLAEIEKKGKGDWILNAKLADSDGTEVAKARITYFAIPATRGLVKG